MRVGFLVRFSVCLCLFVCMCVCMMYICMRDGYVYVFFCVVCVFGGVWYSF